MRVLAVTLILLSASVVGTGRTAATTPSPGGVQQWADRQPGPDIRSGKGSSIAASPDGSRVVVTGFVKAPSGTDFGTAVYDSASGAELWFARYNGPANS